MLSCKDVTARVSASLERELCLRERLAVNMHLVICKACRRMVRQMELLRLVSRHLASEDAEKDMEMKTLPQEARQRIRQRLKDR